MHVWEEDLVDCCTSVELSAFFLFYCFIFFIFNLLIFIFALLSSTVRLQFFCMKAAE